MVKRSSEGLIDDQDWDTLADMVEFYTTLTDPPNGKFKVTNIYVELVGGQPKLRVEYDDGEPE